MNKEKTFWDINYIVGRKQFEALAWGLLSCGGQLLDSYKHTSYARDTFSVRISLPPDKVETFKIVTRLELVAKPALAANEAELNTAPTASDTHAERAALRDEVTRANRQLDEMGIEHSGRTLDERLSETRERLSSAMRGRVADTQRARLAEQEVTRLRAAGRAYLNVATFSAWDAGDCRMCGGGAMGIEHSDTCEYAVAEQAMRAALKGGD